MYLLAFVTPYPSEETALTSGMWRVVFAGPAVLALIQLILALFVFKYDTPKFYLMNRQMNEYNAVMKCIYSKSNLDICEENLMDQEKKSGSGDLQDMSHSNKSCGKEKQQSSFGDNKALFVGICLSAFHQFTGINGVCFNSNKIFVEGVSGLAAEKAARYGSLLIGVAGLLGTGFSVYISKHYTKKKLMLFGEIEMALNHFLLCFFIYLNSKTLQILGTNIFVFTFNASLGQAMWVYTSETIPSNGMTIVAFVNMLTTVIFGAFTNEFIKLLGNIGFFFALGTIQVIAFGFIYVFTKDRTVDVPIFEENELNDKSKEYIELQNSKGS